MRLNIDCVREVMLAIESAEFNQTFTIPELSQKLPKYSQDEIHYTCVKLYEGGYIDAVLKPFPGKAIPAVVAINCLTYDGHKFVDTVRDNKVCSAAKNIASKFASVSISMFENIAVQVATNLLTQYIASNPISLP